MMARQNFTRLRFVIITGSWNVTFNRKGKQNKYSLIVTSSLELPQEVLCPEAPGH